MMQKLIAIGILAFILFGDVDSIIKPKPPAPGPDIPAPVPSVDESQVWEEFGAWVENNPTGNVTDTDHIVKMGQSLKAAGILKDISRLDGYAQNFQEITSENRKQIADNIRGK